MTEDRKIIDFPTARTLPETKLNVAHLVRKRPLSIVPPAVLDLSGHRKLLFVTGAGNTGKTLFCRWAAEFATGDFALATCDMLNRDLTEYFDGVLEAPADDPLSWLGSFFLWLTTGGRTDNAAINFGGTDTLLPALVQDLPEFAEVLAAAGIEPVLVVMLSPRVSDLASLAVLDEVGFAPRATAIVCNLGTVRSERRGEMAFRDITNHSAFCAAVARGAAHVWMPAMRNAGPRIETVRAGFRKAAEAGDEAILDVFDRIRLGSWLREMAEAFKPIASWLP